MRRSMAPLRGQSVLTTYRVAPEPSTSPARAPTRSQAAVQTARTPRADDTSSDQDSDSSAHGDDDSDMGDGEVERAENIFFTLLSEDDVSLDMDGY